MIEIFRRFMSKKSIQLAAAGMVQVANHWTGNVWKIRLSRKVMILIVRGEDYKP